MSLFDIHLEAIDSRASAYHEFLLSFSKRARTVYGFVEGRQDPSFYQGQLDSLLPRDWRLILFPSGAKKTVYQIHKTIDWRRFPKERVSFFVDRDLSDLVGERWPNDRNIFVTDEYSIENYVANAESISRILKELNGFHSCSQAELQHVLNLFDKQLEIFCRLLTQIMAWLVLWRRASHAPNTSNIQLKQIFTIDCGKPSIRSAPIGAKTLREYLHRKCGIDDDGVSSIAAVESELLATRAYRTYARGKFVIWFVASFCDSVRKEAPQLCPSMKKIPKPTIPVSSDQVLAVYGPRCRTPESLRTFVSANHGAFIQKMHGKI